MRKRPDLIARRQRYQGRNYWVVKEPVGLKYFRFQDEEYAILQMLDGDISFDEIRQRFQQRFAPQKITLNDLQQFVGMLHRNGLVVSAAAGQGYQLKRRRDERRRKERLAMLSNVLALRFKGIDPERFLNRLYPWTAWFFSPILLILSLVMATGALSLVLVQFDVFQAKLPAFHEFFGAKNWLWLGLTLAVTKVLHELGHGLSCKHFGGECHEIGVMFLVLTPCLYCNVSDSWMLPSKWKRAAIGSAGMYVELILASLATFVWWFSEPGMLNHLALRVMFICSVSTVLFNGNPLLRFDGYYILADLVEIPNLRQKSSSILNRILAKWCLGMELPEEPFLPQRNRAFFALYTLAAVAYRWLILISILVFLYKVFEPYGLQIIGQAIATASIGGMVVMPLWKLGKFFHTPGRIEQVKRPYLYTTLALLAALLAAVLLVPLPHRVTCTVEIRPRDAASVYVEVPGRLDQVKVEPGDQVDAGAVLARLSNLDVQVSMAALTGQRQELELHCTYLAHQRSRDEQAGQEWLEACETLAAVKAQCAEKDDELRRLTLAAPVAGTVLPPPPRPASSPEGGRLPSWSGSLLEPRNLGATITDSALFCEIGDPRRLEAVLVIDQSDIERIVIGQEVEVKLDALPGRTFAGRIEEMARTNLQVAPRSLSNQAGGDLATRTDAAGVTHPLSTSYRARVPLDDVDVALQLGLRGRAKVHAGWQTLGRRLWRYLSHTFHFLL
ncbi:MAG: hemolysin D [Planctomycetes bacterium RBG_16_64_10]|nr:MAG: hemolysin D [Planctomycetes bacterium RBG_16_64_10]